MNDAGNGLEHLAFFGVLTWNLKIFPRDENKKHTGILPKLLCNSPNAAICGAKAFRLASHKFRKAMPAWRHKD